MKKSIHYIAWLFCAAFAFTACEKIEPDYFDKDANGAYFDYQYAADFEKLLNFSEHIVGDPDTVTVTLNVKLLGYLMEDERTLSVKTKEIEGYEPVDVFINEVVFSIRSMRRKLRLR